MVGCLGVVALVGVFLLSSALAGLVGLKGGGQVVGGLVIMVGMFWFAWWIAGWKAELAALEKSKTQKLIQNIGGDVDGFSVTHEYITPSGRAFIAIDEGQLKLRLGGRTPHTNAITSRTVDINTVLGVQVSENGHGVFGSDVGNVLGAAAIGGIAFGGAGAIVGAIAGRNTKKISDVSLVIGIDDLSTPFIAVNFVESEVVRGSPEHLAALDMARKWMGSVNVLLSRRERIKEIHPSNPSSATP